MAIRVRNSQPDARDGSRGELAGHLGRELRGEVRADAYTRHLFASDASMYASAPLLVAFPRDADDVAAAIAAAARFEVPVRHARRRHQPRRPDRAGRASCSTRRGTWTGSRDVDPEARRVRVGPGVVQEDLNRAAQPPRARLRPGHLDVQPGDDRRDDRQQLVGQPLDRLRHHDRPRPRARRRPLRRLARAAARGRRGRAGAAGAGADARGRDLPRAAGDPARPRAARSPSDYPKHWRQSGGYRLDRLAAGPQFDLARFVTGSEGTLVAITEATVGLVELPKAKMFAVGHFDSVDARDRGHARRARARRRRDRDDRPHDPRAVALQARVPPALGDARGRSRGAAVRDLLRRHAGGGRRHSSTASRRPGSRHGHGYHTLRAETAAEQDALTKVRKAGLGLLMAASTRRPPAARVRRGHRGGARAARRVRRALPRDPRPPRPEGRLLRPLLRRLPAHPPVRRPDRAGRRRDDARRSPTRSPSSSRSSTA